MTLFLLCNIFQVQHTKVENIQRLKEDDLSLALMKISV